MDTNFTSQLALSLLFFAPGIVLFVGLAFVGMLMLLEKTVFKGQSLVNTTNVQKPLEMPQAVNPAPGKIVDGLKESVKEPAAAKHARRANQ